MTIDPEPELASECRAVLEAWLCYWTSSGQSAGLIEKTEALIQRLPERDSVSWNYEPVLPPEECPWPKEVFAMTTAEYVRAIPDPDKRTAISGLLMRLGWECAMKQIAESKTPHD